TQIEEGPVVGCHSVVCQMIVALADDAQVFGGGSSLMIGTEHARWECSQSRADHDGGRTAPSTIGRDEWFLVEGMSCHISQFLHQPVLAVEVVENNEAVVCQECEGGPYRLHCGRDAYEENACVNVSEG